MIIFRAHVDAAGGSGRDSYALGIAFRDPGSEKLVLAAVREVKPPFSPEAVTAEFAATLKAYGIYEATADRYAGSWPREQFAKCGVTLTASQKTTSELFLEFLPLLNSGRVELLDDKRVINQLCALERKVGRGRDYVAAGPGAHDDVACVVAGCIVAVAREEQAIPITMPGIVQGEIFDRFAPNWHGAAPYEGSQPVDFFGIGAGSPDERHDLGSLAWARRQLAGRET